MVTMDENVHGLKKQAFSGAVWKTAERICAQVVSLVVSVILARLLLPEDYGVVSIVAIFFTFCNVFITGGLNTALIQKKDTDEADYSTVLHVSMILAAVMYTGLFFCAPAIAKLYEKEILIPVIRVMALTFFINAYRSVLAARISHTLQFRKFFFATIIGTAISAVVGISMAYSGYGPWALVAQQMTNSLIGTIVLAFVARIKIQFRITASRLKPLIGYSWKILATSLISTIYSEISPLVIGLKYSGADLAYYSKGKGFPSVLDSTITHTLNAVLFPVMSKVQDDTNAVLNITRRYIKTASYVVFPLMIGFFAVSEAFVTVVLTEKWMPIVPYIKIFCIGYMLNIIQVGNLQTIKAIGRSDVSLKLEILKKSIYFVIVALFVFFGTSPIALAVSSLVCTVIASLINTYPNRKLIGYGYWLQIMDLLPNFIIAVLMGIGVNCLNVLDIAPVALLLLQIVTGVVLYILLSIITHNKNFRYLLDTLLNFVKR